MSALWLGFGVGAYAAGQWFVPAGSGLAGPAIAIAYGLGAAVIAGAAAAFGVTQLLRAQLYGVAPGDPVTMFVVVMALFAVAALAAYAPARRATRIEPMAALRTE